MKNSIIKKSTALLMAFALCFQMFFPAMLIAGTGGPNSPEFSSFESVSTSGMVNDFSGSFSYNVPVIEIPGPDGGSYAMSLSYHSGSSPNEMASWVGYGWTLNPGSISRNIRGNADDANGSNTNYKPVIHYNQIPRNTTVSISGSTGLSGMIEAFGIEVDPNSLTGGLTDLVDITAVAQYNNRQGFTLYAMPTASLNIGVGTLNYSVDQDNNGSFSAALNTGDIVSAIKRGVSTMSDNEPKTKSEKSATVAKIAEFANNALLGTASGVFKTSSYISSPRPTVTSSYSGATLQFQLDLSTDPSPLPITGITKATFEGNVAIQDAEWKDNLNHYGYLYNALAYADNENVMDYILEKESAYKKQDKYLAIPYSSPDIYNVSGEGVGGSFRFYSRSVGYFRPNAKESNTVGESFGGDVHLGTNFGAGLTVGVSNHTLEVGGWGEVSDAGNYSYQSSGDESFFAAFEGDPAMNMDFGSEESNRASLTQKVGVPYLKEYKFQMPDGITSKANNEDERIKRSSFIAYHTNAQMTEVALDGSSSGKEYNRYALSNSSETWVNRVDPSIQDGIGEFAVYNSSGTRYVYGLPVYSRNEINLQFGIKSGDDIQDNYIVYKPNIEEEGSSLIKIGTEDANPYASEYLLTEIVTPNYIDRTMDGPSTDDFGGYVKFNYDQHLGNGSGDKAGTDDNWYQWRIPYSGLIYNKGKLSDPNDDMGMVSTGQREVYYCESVETKTHIAIFYKSDRNDGVEAMNASTSTEVGFYDAIKSDYFDAAKATPSLQKLDSIKLYAKNTDGTITESKPLKRVFFKYNYSSWAGQPNTKSGEGSGMLTLEKVWTEYGNVFNPTILPTTFEYVYPATNYPDEYAALENYADVTGDGVVDLNESPTYTNFLTDRWGCYQENGVSLHNNMFEWLDQTPATTFDPAAYQLKQIKLPTGGEIHVQYEQNTYRYVQDKPAMVMVPLSSITDGGIVSELVDGDAKDKYKLDLASVGIESSDYEELATLIQKQFIDAKVKMYFKFLYNFKLMTTDPSVEECGSEYISGYVDVKSVVVKSDADAGVYLTLGGTDPDEYKTPHQVCRDEFNAMHNLIEIDACTKPDDVDDEFVGGNIGGPESGIDADAAQSAGSAFLNSIGKLADNIIACANVNESLSYLRIPTTVNKLGGGIRVKRILTYDKGIESNPVLYGSEYVYENENGLSSGVATNEPEAGGEENALVEFMPEGDQTLIDKVISGVDREQSEGPIGKYTLPGASVGYSRVVTKNIHSGVTNSGFSVNQYHTVKDWPYNKSWYTADNILTVAVTETEGEKPKITIDNSVKPIKGESHTDINWEQDHPIDIYAVVLSASVFNIWATQGYAFNKNNMHGQPISSATYTGSYDNINDPLTTSLAAMVETEYYMPGEPVKVMNKWNDIEYKQLGKCTEVVAETRAIKDNSLSVSASIDLTAGAVPPPLCLLPFFTWVPFVESRERELYTHVTNTITSYPVLTKSVKTFQDGRWTYSNSEVFDANTGTPLITKTSDDFNGLKLADATTKHEGNYYNFGFPAAHQYNELDKKSISEGFVVNSTDVAMTYAYDGTDAMLLFSGDICDYANIFSPGDFLAIKVAAGTNFYQSAGLNGTTMKLYPIKGYDYSGALGAGTSVTSVTIVRSGRLNQLSASVGSISVYGDKKTDDVDFADYKSTTEKPAGYDAELALREVLADKLTKQFNDVKSATSLISRSHSLSGLQIADEGVCQSSKSTLSVDMAYITAGTSVGSFSFPDDMIQVAFFPNCFNYIPITTGGKFSIDIANGQLVFENSCSVITELECFSFCNNIYTQEKMDGVISASASHLSDQWALDADIATLFDVDMSSVSNPYEIASEGKWRGLSGSVYREDITNISNANGAIYNSGIYKEPLTLYNWQYDDANTGTKWVKGSIANMYSPYGSPLEEQNILGIKSSSKKGYGNTVPYLVAANAAYRNTQFESFEYKYADDASNFELEDGYTIAYGTSFTGGVVSNTAHSGSKSYSMPMEPKSLTVTVKGISTTTKFDAADLKLKQIDVDAQIAADGLTVKLWLKVVGSNDEVSYLNLKVGTVSASFSKVARVGEWTLYEAQTGAISSTGLVTPTITVRHKTGGVAVLFDDLRMQPTTSQMAAYVYDSANLRILAQLDDQNFAAYYQYNQEGKLVRMLRETERGIMTVQESQYNVPGQTRP